MELEDDFARRLLPDADVEEYQRVAPASARHFGWYERRGRGQNAIAESQALCT